MQKLSLFGTLVLALSALSFQWSNSSTDKLPAIGHYGVCSTSPGAEVLQLKLNDNYSFTLIDHTRAKKPIEVSGKWTNDGRSIKLSEYGESVSIPQRWNLTKNYPCITTRQGMKFIRLCDCSKE